MAFRELLRIYLEIAPGNHNHRIFQAFSIDFVEVHASAQIYGLLISDLLSLGNTKLIRSDRVRRGGIESG